MEKESAHLYDCHVNTNEGEDTFVGIRSDGEQIKICFPIGYKLGNTEIEKKKDAQLLIRVLSRFSGIKEKLLPQLLINNPETINFPIQAYMTILNEYYNRGYYTENERVFKVNGNGHKSWSRTVKTQRAYPQDDSFIYLTTVARESKVDTANYITKINEFCVEEAYKKIGFLFSPNTPKRSTIPFDEKRFLISLKAKLRGENNDKNKALFSSMIDMIQYVGKKGRNTRFFFGTNDFEYVWERLIDFNFGIDNKNYYFPRTSWYLGSTGKYAKSALEPDTIMLEGNKVFILDAKYYRYSSVPSLLFSQEGLKTGKYTMMLEHINDVPFSSIYVNVLFYDKNSNSKITITKYGSVTFNFDMNINHAGIPAYSSFMGLDVARVRTLVPDSVYDSDQRIIRKQNIGEVISNPTHEFKDGSAYWLSDFFNQNDKYPRLNTKDYIYTMLEFEVISTEGIACSIAAYKNEDVHDNFENYITYDEMVSKSPYPEWGSDCYKGIAEFMPETVAELEFIIDDDSVGEKQEITTSNPFGNSGYITVDRWKTHQNPQADRYNPDHNVTSDIIPLIYNDPFHGKLYFDTVHKKNGIDLLEPPKLIEENNGEERYSSNRDIACNLANFSVRETYKIKAQNITDYQRTLCYQLETSESNVFVSVRDSRGNYVPFTIDELDEQVEAICTGEVNGSDREKFHPITNGKIRVELPESQNDLTQIKLDVKAHCTEEFYIDITLSGANNGGIYNKVFFE